MAFDPDIDAAGSDDEDEQVPEKRLRFVDVLTEVPNGDAANAKELLMSERGLTSIDTLESLPNMKKLELKDNHLKKLDFLEMNHGLCWLGLAKNKLKSISHLQNLRNLAVLDISDNRISALQGLDGLSGLKALIAARNRITRVEGLSPTKNPSLETIVLSHNRIVECRLAKFTNLKKLSLGHNMLHAFPELVKLPALAELRLNSNKITSVTDTVVSLPKLSQLDVGNNLIIDVTAMTALRGLLWLKSLNLSGNPVGKDSPELDALIATLPKLEILNDKRRSGTPAKKVRKGRDRDPAKPKVEAVSVNGRAFEGKRAVFEDSDEETFHLSKPQSKTLTPTSVVAPTSFSATPAKGTGRGRGRNGAREPVVGDSGAEAHPPPQLPAKASTPTTATTPGPIDGAPAHGKGRGRGRGAARAAAAVAAAAAAAAASPEHAEATTGKAQALGGAAGHEGPAEITKKKRKKLRPGQAFDASKAREGAGPDKPRMKKRKATEEQRTPEQSGTGKPKLKKLRKKT